MRSNVTCDDRQRRLFARTVPALQRQLTIDGFAAELGDFAHQLRNAAMQAGYLSRLQLGDLP
ncbi:MAG TPA: hypothetical protein VIA18_00975 [Polyangia bacterium]|jgi:hypothetical protein|nr:hypothetical protein [Polyangia bacterium]